LLNKDKFYHFRFQALNAEQKLIWVDITNLNAKAPVVNNNIYMKALPITNPSYSKVFFKLWDNNSTGPQ